MSQPADAVKPLLLRDLQNQVMTLTLNQPERYNPLTGDTLAELQTALEEIAQDQDIRVVIIAATGKAFSAGHDLKEIRGNDDVGFIQALFDRCAEVMQTINQLPQPVIAQVNGVATAAGCQLVAACDLAVASEEARFAVSGINYGLFCSAPAVPLSRNLSRKRAMKMLLTGDFIDAGTALDYGLINDAVPADQLESTTRALAARIIAKSAHAIRIGKDMFYRQIEMDLSEALFYGARRMACNMDSHDAREGFDAFLQKRQPTWKHE